MALRLLEDNAETAAFQDNVFPLPSPLLLTTTLTKVKLQQNAAMEILDQLMRK